jgi:GalNAc-alpha-(1->4)-GalNAc-alpha-(1->3)-diNAcBac-PP-undecaprenol alpha-1,4-N-acetyl-D-galactosaminyltransferase
MIACDNLNLSLLIVGDGPEMQNLSSLAKTLGAKIDFVGNASQSELIEHLQDSKFYILNSTADATAYSLLEARSCGLIAIANIETGASQIIEHEKDGYLTKSTNHQEVEKSLRWLLSRESKDLKAMREASRNSTVSHFNRNVNFEKILELMVN